MFLVICLTMTRTEVSRTIDAPLDLVFQTVADIKNYSKAVPDIVKVEFIGDQQSGLGTRFRETRLMKGKEASTELEVTEFEENRKIRLVTDSNGCIWDSVFETEEKDGAVELSLPMDAKPYRLLQRIVTPLINKMIAGAVESDMDAVKVYCEKKAEEGD